MEPHRRPSDWRHTNNRADSMQRRHHRLALLLALLPLLPPRATGEAGRRTHGNGEGGCHGRWPSLNLIDAGETGDAHPVASHDARVA